MPLFKCRMCGEAWDIPEGAVTAECPQCGTIQAIAPEVPDVPEEKPLPVSAPSTGMKIIIAAALVFIVAVVVWYGMWFTGAAPEEATLTISDLRRETVQAQRMGDTTKGIAPGQNARAKYEEKAAQGDPWAQYNLGEMYYTGQGVEKNLREAVKWFRKAADQEHAEAQNRMGDAYYNGWGVEKNYKEAVKWYQKAATHESSDAQTAMGTLYYNGAGVVKSYFNAFWWYSQAAEHGDVWALYYLGNMYRNGLGVKRDIKKARELYEKASEQGHIGAMRALEHTKSFKLLDGF